MDDKEVSGKRRAMQTIALVVILLIGLSLRLFLIYHANTKAQLWGDEFQYDQIGWNLAQGNGYRLDNRLTAGRVPVAPLLIAAVYAATGEHNQFHAQTAWAFLDVINCLLVFAIAVIVSRTRSVGVAASAIYMFNPVFIRLSSHVLSEIPFVTMLLSSLLLLIMYWRSRSWKLLFLSGVAMGLSMLARPTTMLFPAIVIGIMFFDSRKERSPWIARAALYTFMVALVVAPWTIRSSMLFKHFVPLSTYGGWALWCGSGSGPHGEIVGGPWFDLKARTIVQTRSEVEADKYLRMEAIRIIKANPVRWGTHAVRRFFILWFRLFKADFPISYRVLLALTNLLILVFAWWGTRLTGNRMLMQLLISMFVYFSIMHMLTYAELRYAAPAYAYMIPFAAIGMISWLSRFIPSLRAPASEIRP